MATHQMSILNSSLMFDIGVYTSKMSSEMSLTNAKGQTVIVFPYPSGADLGIEGVFTIPQNYVGTPKFVIRYIVDGTSANDLAFGATQICVAAAATTDVAYEAEDLVTADQTGLADEEYGETSITITPTATYAAGKPVFWHLYRDDSVDSTTFNVLVFDVLFQYADA
jgi:hypothetical protein